MYRKRSWISDAKKIRADRIIAYRPRLSGKGGKVKKIERIEIKNNIVSELKKMGVKDNTCLHWKVLDAAVLAATGISIPPDLDGQSWVRRYASLMGVHERLIDRVLCYPHEIACRWKGSENCPGPTFGHLFYALSSADDEIQQAWGE